MDAGPSDSQFHDANVADTGCMETETNTPNSEPPERMKAGCPLSSPPLDPRPYPAATLLS